MDAASGVALGLSLSGTEVVCCAPVETAEGYQFTTLVALWRLDVQPQAQWDSTLAFSFSRLRS